MKKLVMLAAVLAVAVNVFAAEKSFIKGSIVGPICLPKNVSEVGGLDIGLLSTKTPSVTGVQLAIGVSTTEEMVGLQSAWIMSVNTKKLTGVQGGIVASCEGDATGVQWGFINKADNMTGVQFGFVNWANKMKGIQLGLVNTIKTGPLPVFVFINGNF